MKEPTSSTMPLLQLTLAFLEKVEPAPGPVPKEYVEDLKERAYCLLNQPAAAVAELFCRDWEDLQAELEADPGPEMGSSERSSGRAALDDARSKKS
jgi:hypothetical protein